MAGTAILLQLSFLNFRTLTRSFVFLRRNKLHPKGEICEVLTRIILEQYFNKQRAALVPTNSVSLLLHSTADHTPIKQLI
jgi:hypothetical protein